MSSSTMLPRIKIFSYKHNGSFHREWAANYVLTETNRTIIGVNDKTKVTESDGTVWFTKEPAILYFHSGLWFNVIGMIQTDGIHYYCNMCSPFDYDKKVLKYIDYDIDIRVYPDGTYSILDEDEYDENKALMKYPLNLDRILAHNTDHLLRWIRQRKGPFSTGFVNKWYEKYLTMY